MTNRTSISWILLSLALVAWGAVGFFGWTIYTDESDRLIQAENEQSASLERASVVRTHALALDTVAQGKTLGDLLNVDVVSVADMIEAAGKAARVTVRLGNAVPENVPTSEILPVKAVGFTVEATGTFSALMHLARLFEELPLPSTVTRLDLERVPAGASTSQWRMNASIRVLTTSDISS